MRRERERQVRVMRTKTCALFHNKNVFPESGHTAHCAQRRAVNGAQRDGEQRKGSARAKSIRKEEHEESAFGVKGQKKIFFSLAQSWRSDGWLDGWDLFFFFILSLSLSIITSLPSPLTSHILPHPLSFSAAIRGDGRFPLPPSDA